MSFSKHRFSPAEQAILQTLLYSDIFEFPLTKQEIWRLLMSSTDVDKDTFEQALLTLSDPNKYTKKEKNADILIFQRHESASDDSFQGITSDHNLYCLVGREDTIEKRKNNFLEVKEKLDKAQRAAYYLSFIPTITFIGLSGGLAVGNASKEDDIDFFVITKKNTLFLTRFWILLLLEAFGLRRKRNDKHPTNKICVNLLLDVRKLSWPQKEQDLYVAHEIVQMRPLFERKETYKAFIESNSWIKKFFPNFNKRQQTAFKIQENNYWILRVISFFLFLRPFEYLMRVMQQYYMKKHATIETISHTILALHPNDYKSKTMDDLRVKYRKLGLLTNF